MAAVLAAVFLMPSATADAGEVTLTSLDGDITLSGELLSFDGDFYRIASVYGVLTVDADRVDCVGRDCPVGGEFVAQLMISGAAVGTERLIPALIEGFAIDQGYGWVRQDEDATHVLYVLTAIGREAPVAEIRVRRTTSAEGFADLVAEQADIAVSFREPLAAELALAGEAGLGDLSEPGRARVAALDALVPVVGRTSALSGLTLDDLAGVLAGEITTWPATDGPEATVSAHLIEPATAANRAVQERILAARDLEFGPDLTWHRDRDTLLVALDRDAFAIGLMPLSTVRGGARPLPILGACGVAIAPTAKAVKAEDYPLTQPHYLYVPRRRLPRVARAFLAYAAGPEGQTAIREAGFVDQAIDATPIDAQGERLARAILGTGEGEVSARDLREMLRTMSRTARLTPTFRFEDGSAALDAPSLASIAVVVEAVRRGDFDGRTLVVAGFGDGQGAASANLRLSEERAEAVRDAILNALPPEYRRQVTIEADGFGEALPLACDEDGWGRRVNRRVELWLVQR